MTTRDALDALSVAHDALIEGRDGAAAMTETAPWARYDRLLPEPRYWAVSAGDILADLKAVVEKQLGPNLDLESPNILVTSMSVYANQLAKFWDEMNEIYNKIIIIDGIY